MDIDKKKKKEESAKLDILDTGHYTFIFFWGINSTVE